MTVSFCHFQGPKRVNSSLALNGLTSDDESIDETYATQTKQKKKSIQEGRKASIRRRNGDRRWKPITNENLKEKQQ